MIRDGGTRSFAGRLRSHTSHGVACAVKRELPEVAALLGQTRTDRIAASVNMPNAVAREIGRLLREAHRQRRNSTAWPFREPKPRGRPSSRARRRLRANPHGAATEGLLDRDPPIHRLFPRDTDVRPALEGSRMGHLAVEPDRGLCHPLTGPDRLGDSRTHSRSTTLVPYPWTRFA